MEIRLRKAGKRNLTNESRRYLYLIKEPVGLGTKLLLSLVAIETGFIVFLITDIIYAMYVSLLAVVLIWWITNWIYGIYKIGITNNLDRRLTAINNGNARTVFYIFTKELDAAGTIETKIHHQLDKKRRGGEWFVLWFWQVWWLWFRYFRK